MPLYSPVHLNGDLLCAIDVGTTGLDSKKCDLVHVAIIPLRPDYRPNPDIDFFELKIQPDLEKTNMPFTRMNREKLKDYYRFGVDRFFAADLFEKWFQKLNLPERKKIVPVGHNYVNFDQKFLREWLGDLTYDYHISPYARDTMIAGLFVNDVYDIHSEDIPFPKRGLRSLCDRLGIDRFEKGGPIEDARAAAEAYRLLTKMKFP